MEAADNVSPNEMGTEPERISDGSRNLERIRPSLRSFTGKGLNVTWDKEGDDMEGEDGGYTPEMREEIFGEDEAEDETDEVDDVFNNNSSDTTRSDGIKGKYVFVLEILSNRHFMFAMVAIYLAFVAYYVVKNAYEWKKSKTGFPVATFPPNATSDDFTCYRQPDGTCQITDFSITVGQAYLLANTVVVSGGINASEWLGDGVKPGTSPLSVYTGTSSFATESFGVLEQSANPQLLPYWDDIFGVVWASLDSNYKEKKNVKTYRNVQLVYEIHKLDGDWPSHIHGQRLDFFYDFYTCVIGGEDFCQNIGNWRVEYGSGNPCSVSVKVEDGNKLMIEAGDYSDSDAGFLRQKNMRAIFTSNGVAGELIRDCLGNRTCSIRVSFTGIRNHAEVTSWVHLSYFTIYLAFFIWWLFTLRKRKGGPKMWPVENWWLVAFGVGFLFEVNPLKFGLDLSSIYDDSFKFSQGAYAAASILSCFGSAMLFFAILCFIDSPRRYVATRSSFYGWKSLFIALFFISEVIIILANYPQASGRDEPGTEYKLGRIGFGTSIPLWTSHDRTVRACAVTFWTVLLTFGFVYYIWKSFVGFRLLDKLPYGMTRHTQLSFRFFFFSSFIWVIGEYVSLVANYFSALNISKGKGENYVMALSLTYKFSKDVSIASATFIVVFIVVLQVFFLPLSSDDPSGRKNKTHYLSEDDMENSSQSEQDYLMILDRARLLCICSDEVYLPFDKEELLKLSQPTKGPKKETESDASILEEKEQSLLQPLLSTKDSVSENMAARLDSLDGTSDRSTYPTGADSHAIDVATRSDPDSSSPMEKPGLRLAGERPHGNVTISAISESTWASNCRVVAHVREIGAIDIHDTRVMIFRHEINSDLIVAFRGTATTKQVKTDLMMSKVDVTLDTFLTVPNWKEDVKNTIKSFALERDLISGKVTQVRLFDLLPKDDEELPPYLKDAHKASERIPGRCSIHFGFWSSYNRVRKELHQKIREELLARPGRLLITGHSLGGAQATLCAYDMCRWIVPTVKREILYQFQGGREQAEKIHVSCYTFGSPKVGSPKFAGAYNKVVPDTQRIVCDGDVITSGPSLLGYHHVRRENIFDFTGTVRVEPSLMEKEFSTKTRNSANSHRMANYLKVIKKAFDPMMSERELLNIMRKAYGLKLE